jgi:hypothetical protein
MKQTAIKIKNAVTLFLDKLSEMKLNANHFAFTVGIFPQFVRKVGIIFVNQNV